MADKKVVRKELRSICSIPAFSGVWLCSFEIGGLAAGRLEAAQRRHQEESGDEQGEA
jgi:hypothetical protein